MVGPLDLKADGHIHTRLCNHARGTMEQYIESALALGLQRITFLEHLEVNIRYDHRTWLRAEDLDIFFQTGKKLAQKYRHRILIKLGLEVGLNPRAMEAIRRRLSYYPCDTIGLSYHFYLHNGRHYNMVSQRHENLAALAEVGQDVVITDYLSGLAHGIQELPCSVVCHLDAVLRHFPHRRFNQNHQRQIEALLVLMKKRGTALEINTSGFAIGNEPYPSKRIVHSAIEAGIPLVAGSDAHRPEDVGRYFDRLPEWLQQ